MSQQTAPTPPAPPTPKKRRFRILQILGILALLLAVLVLTGPWIVAHTGLRDTTINAILASPSVTASSEKASFGWLSPLSVHGLELKSENKRVHVRVDDMTAEKTLLQLLTSTPDLGTIRINKPHVRLELPLDVEIRGRGKHLEPTFTAIAKEAALTVRYVGQDEPVFEVDDISMTFRVEKSEDGRVLTLDPFIVFEKRKLSSKLAKNLLYLFDPTIADAPQVGGEVSLYLDKLRVPLGIPKEQAATRIEMEGKLVLHQVSTQVKNPVGQALIELVAGMNGKQASNVVRLAQDSEIRFQVRNGRMHHEGLRIGFPDIDPALQVTSRGSVGLDKTLDLFVELPRLDQAQRKEKGPAKCHITGTIDQPKIAVEDGSFVLHQRDHKEPIIAVDGINLNMRVEKGASGPVLIVEPVEVFKNAKLNLVTANGLVSLIVPDVEAERHATGEISLALKTARIPLGVPRDQMIKGAEVEGKLTLHHITTDIKKPMWQALIKLLADMNDKQPSHVVRLIDGAEIEFKLRDGRMYHDGLRVGFPEIDPGLQVATRGSVGLDKSLDLYVDLPRLDKALRKEKGPAKCHITGAIDKPKINIADASLVLRQPGHKEPIIAVDGMNLTMQVENTAAGIVLAVEPVEVFKNAKLSLVAANGLVSLIVPDVEAERQVTGEISLSLGNVRIPIGGADKKELGKRGMEMEGKLTLHHITTEVKKPMWQALIKLIADMNGKPTSNVVRLIDGSEIKFQLRDGRMHHEGLRVGFPEIDPELVLSSRGSIGADESLDIHLEFPRLRKEKRDSGLVKCHVTGTLSEPKVSVADGALIVQLSDTGKADLMVDNINLTFGVEKSKDGRMLTLAPVTVLEKRKISPELADQMLKLIAPTLSELSGVQGEISLSFDTFRVPLGVPKIEAIKGVELAGKLQLHEIIVSTKTPLVQTLVKLLADRYDKKPSDVVRVVENAEVKFQVREGRMHHDGFRIGFPDISPDLLISSRGSVGFDKSLDLMLEMPRIVFDKKELTIVKGKAPVRFQVTGTIDKPIVTEIKEEKDK